LLNNSPTISVTGSSGNDVITTGAVLTTGSVNGGAGTDRLIVSNTGHITAAAGARYSGFESVQVANGVTVDASQLTAGNTLTAARFTTGGQINNMTTAMANDVTVTAGGNALTMNIAGATGAGTINSMTIKADDDLAAINNVNLLTPTSQGLENLTVTATDNVAIAGLTNMVDLTNVTINGAGGYTVTSNNLALNPTFTFNAATATGNGVVDFSAATTRAARITVGSGTNTTVGTAIANTGDTITTGTGTNTVIADGNAEVQTLTVSNNALTAAATVTVTINGIQTTTAAQAIGADQATVATAIRTALAANNALAAFTISAVNNGVITITAPVTVGNIAPLTAAFSAAQNAITLTPATTTQGALNISGDTINAGAGPDRFFISAGNANNTIANADTIIGLNLGGATAGTAVDTFTLFAAAGTNAAIVALTNAQVANVTAAANLGAATAVALGATNAAGQVVQFTYGGSTYLTVAGDGNGGTYDVATDYLINVTGYTGTLDASDITFVA